MRFNVIGHVTSEIGLGVMAADLVKALDEAGHEVRALDVDPGLGRKNRAREMLHYCVSERDLFRDGVDLLIFPISAVGHWSRAYTYGTRKVAIPLWELPDLNPCWLNDLMEFDGVAAPSEFIADTLERYQYPMWRIVWPHYLPLTPTKTLTPDPSPKGDGQEVVFTFAFDPSSDVQRKNPQAIVAAFQAAAMPNARLVLQINRSEDQVQALDHWLRDCIDQRSEHVTVINRHLSHAEAVALIADSDVYVSLHRAEGLGLGGNAGSDATGQACDRDGLERQPEFYGPRQRVPGGLSIAAAERGHSRLSQ